MCGRYTLTPSLDVILEHYALEDVIESYRPRYNIAPSQEVLVVRSTVEPQHRILIPMHWGLIPHWAKDRKIGYRMINAVGETLTDKPSYRTPFKKRRCLIPASGFYEWKVVGEKVKQPYYIRISGREVFSFAGLWEHWEGDGGIYSCTIITTEANDTARSIHNRMPAILDPKDYDLWLNPSAPQDALQSLLVPYTAHPMETYPVSNAVNTPKNDDPRLTEPLH
ncbi:MAG: SOS response-associated peptidase [Gammaproteobacteria bacterium]|nr:SOS response-associated peptidase [Gammaproteobacteria bacterium]